MTTETPKEENQTNETENQDVENTSAVTEEQNTTSTDDVSDDDLTEDQKAAQSAGQSTKRFFGVGKRKTSVARLYITPGSGEFTINGKNFDEYFGREAYQKMIAQPMEVTGNIGKFSMVANVNGGGLTGQAQAIRHGLARALLALNPDYRKPLNRNGFLTRDSRQVERKKYGRRKARRSTQFSKR